MSEKYKIKMAHAESCEQVIVRFRKDDDFTKPIHINFASKAQWNQQEVVHSYQEAFEIYRDFNQREKAKSLLDDLFELVRTCDEFTSGFAIQLLSTLKNSHQWMEQVVPGIQDRLKVELRRAVNLKLLQKEREFEWLLSALDIWRDLASDDPERREVDIFLCQIMELGAQVSYRRGHLFSIDKNNHLYKAEKWYRYAAKIAQDRVGSTERANHLLQIAGNIQQIRAGRLPSSTFLQAMQSKASSSPEDVESMHQMDIAESLTVLLHKTMEEQHSERFLPLVEELIADYESKEDKLSTLLADKRLLLNKSKIEELEAKYRDQGLSGWIPGWSSVDSQGNPRGESDDITHLTVQYVTEVAEAIGVLFRIWQEKGYLTKSRIVHLLSHLGSYYNWRIYDAGLSRHFQSDFVCAIHTLIPQFENVVRTSAQTSGVDIKKFKSGVSGDVLLNNLINPDNTEMRELLGEGLFELVYWYLVNSVGPFGYRHKVAHGWIHPQDCNLQLSAMTIWLTLKVVNTIAQVRAS